MMNKDKSFVDFFGSFFGGRTGMHGMIHSIFNNMGELYVKNNEKLDQIRQDWHDSKKFPRKKKKAMRKRILQDWYLFNWCKKYMEEQGYHHFVKKETAKEEPVEERVVV